MSILVDVEKTARRLRARRAHFESERPGHGAVRPLRRRQDDARQPHRRPAPPRPRPDRRRRRDAVRHDARHRRPGPSRGASATSSRRAGSSRISRSRSNLLYGRRFTPRGRPLGLARSRSSTSSASATSSTAGRRASRAARSSASRSAGRCLRARGSSSWTSRSPRSTRRGRRDPPLHRAAPRRDAAADRLCQPCRSTRWRASPTRWCVLADGKAVATGAGRRHPRPRSTSGRHRAGGGGRRHHRDGRRRATPAAASPASTIRPAGSPCRTLDARRRGASVRLRIRARDVAIAVGEPGRISIRNRLAATVVGDHRTTGRRWSRSSSTPAATR